MVSGNILQHSDYPTSQLREVDSKNQRRQEMKEFAHHHPLKCVQWVVLLGGALARMFDGSPQFLFVF